MANIAISDQYGRPLNTSRATSRQSIDAGTLRGSLSSWRSPRLLNAEGEKRERVITSHRADDLYANDWAARSGIKDICLNVIGYGLVPQVKLPHKMLGISKEQADDLQEAMEWVYAGWTPKAHVKGIASFEMLQFSALRSILRNGECFHLPVMLPTGSGRSFGLALQDISPYRVSTPADKIAALNIRDGVQLSPYGAPEGYYIATPTPSYSTPVDYATLSSDQYAFRPAKMGHRKNIFHLYDYEHEEAYRGVSILAPAIKLFRNAADCIDYELLAQVIAAAFPVFIETENANPMEAAQEMLGMSGGFRQAFGPLQMNLGESGVTVGNPGQKPHILESKRPSANFASFMEIILRAQAASMGIAYESMTKDFTKATYSAARAAMNEVWKLYKWYRKWFAALYCQPIFEMLMEEAVLRGTIALPTSLDDFYARQHMWCNATWVGPARGFVDPVKEIQAVIMSLQNGLMTFEDAWGERGEDFDEGLETMREERSHLSTLPPLTLSAQRTVSAPKNAKLVDDSDTDEIDTSEIDTDEKDTDDEEKAHA